MLVNVDKSGSGRGPTVIARAGAWLPPAASSMKSFTIALYDKALPRTLSLSLFLSRSLCRFATRVQGRAERGCTRTPMPIACLYDWRESIVLGFRTSFNAKLELHCRRSDKSCCSDQVYGMRGAIVWAYFYTKTRVFAPASVLGRSLHTAGARVLVRKSFWCIKGRPLYEFCLRVPRNFHIVPWTCGSPFITLVFYNLNVGRSSRIRYLYIRGRKDWIIFSSRRGELKKFLIHFAGHSPIRKSSSGIKFTRAI